MAEREYVYPPVIRAMKVAFRALDLKVEVRGADRIPRSGGAVLASNHISYLDFIFAGAAALPARRRVRFMAKKEVFDNRISGPLMRGMRHIPVDREAGLSSYRQALECLKSGEIVGVFGEATISRSFMIKDLKNGAVRMAQAADVPLIPVVLWGTQRMWTKGRPKKLLQRHVPITVLVGEPMYPKKGQNSAELSAELHKRLSALLDEAQSTYPDKPAGPADSWWLPAHLGGTAPTLEEAAELDARDKAEKAESAEKAENAAKAEDPSKSEDAAKAENAVKAEKPQKDKDAKPATAAASTPAAPATTAPAPATATPAASAAPATTETGGDQEPDAEPADAPDPDKAPATATAAATGTAAEDSAENPAENG
nr:lysophospholipid acyltransferase family protein [Catenulispora pinistramenti]